MNFTEIHSFSSIDKFHNCPKQFQEVRVLKNFKDDFSNKSAVEGNEVHKVLEDTFRYKERDCANEALNPAIRAVWDNIDKMSYKHGEPKIQTELALGIERDLTTPCDFWYNHGGFRGKIDLLAMAGKVAYIVDWKTGRSDYAKMDQLEAMAYLVAQHFPEIEAIFLQLVFVKDMKGCKNKKITVNADWESSFRDSLWRKIRRIENCKKEDGWFAQPNGLCGKYCPVRSCVHNGGYDPSM